MIGLKLIVASDLFRASRLSLKSFALPAQIAPRIAHVPLGRYEPDRVQIGVTPSWSAAAHDLGCLAWHPPNCLSSSIAADVELCRASSSGADWQRPPNMKPSEP